MRLAVIYASTEGQTRKISRFAADHLADAGHMVELLPAADADELDLGRFDAVIVAGSVHAGRYQDELVDFARERAVQLGKKKTLFLSVSLSAAGDDADDWKGLEACVERFIKETGWKPGRIEHVPGAFRFTQYDFFRSWAMRWIAAQKGEKIDPTQDKEYTDWVTLAAALDDWSSG